MLNDTSFPQLIWYGPSHIYPGSMHIRVYDWALYSSSSVSSSLLAPWHSVLMTTALQKAVISGTAGTSAYSSKISQIFLLFFLFSVTVCRRVIIWPREKFGKIFLYDCPSLVSFKAENFWVSIQFIDLYRFVFSLSHLWYLF